MELPASKPYNLELELVSCLWITDKVRSNDSYAQNLYAALCNNQFIKNEVVPILKEEAWSCTWRYAGSIIADIQEKGDYLNWYCSGITNSTYDNVDEELTFRKKQFVPEGHVTDEVKDDLFKLGWIIIYDESMD